MEQGNTINKSIVLPFKFYHTLFVKTIVFSAFLRTFTGKFQFLYPI